MPGSAARFAAALGLLAGLLSACGGAEEPECRHAAERVEDPTNPLMSTSLMAERPDEHRDELATALAAWPAPFGEVLAGVNYHYDQWLHLYGVSGGAIAFTEGNAPVTYLSDESLEPVWALRPDTDRIAWDASGDQFVLLSLAEKQAVEVASYGLSDAKPRWCALLESRYEEGDPVATTILEGGSVVIAAKSGTSAEVVRMWETRGDDVWRANLPSVDRVDYLGVLDDQLVIGGREDHHLASGEFELPLGPAVTAVSAATGKTIWRYSPDAGYGVHVVGVSGRQVVLLEHSTGAQKTRLVGVRANGRRAWTRDVPVTALQSALRGGVVLLKSRTHYLGYDATTGKRLWQWRFPSDKTFTPYGFTLGQVPALDDRHVLLPTTSELWVFDVRVGKPARKLPMPTDGLNTTYWPYQLLATDRIIGVVTNTGAIVLRRTG